MRSLLYFILEEDSSRSGVFFLRYLPRPAGHILKQVHMNERRSSDESFGRTEMRLVDGHGRGCDRNKPWQQIAKRRAALGKQCLAACLQKGLKNMDDGWSVP